MLLCATSNKESQKSRPRQWAGFLTFVQSQATPRLLIPALLFLAPALDFYERGFEVV